MTAVPGMRFRTGLAGVAAALAIAGCATTETAVDAPTVHTFRDTLAVLRATANTALAYEEEAAFERVARNAYSSGEFAALKLESPAEYAPFELRPQGEPLFESIATARAELDQLHALLLAYADALVALAGADATTFDPDAEAGRLRESTAAFSSATGIDVDVPDGAFFGFAELARGYVETRRRAEFVALLDNAQPTIDAFAALAQQRVALSALGVKAEYDAAFSDGTADVDALTDTRRRRLADDLAELNVDTLEQLATLRDLHGAYGTLPGLHASLADAATASDLSARELAEYLRSIRERYRGFRESD